MGKLILTSGGYLDGQRGKECDEIIETFSRNKKVLLVDNATLTGSNQKGVPIIKDNFSKIAKSVTQVSLTENNIKELEDYDVIYITGGDLAPFFELIQKCDLKGAFITYLKNGGIIIGESAGSMIFGVDLKWIYDVKKGTKPKYDIKLPSYKGLGIVNINFFPHWDKASDEMKEKVLSYEKEHHIKITRVQDNGFFVYDVHENTITQDVVEIV